MQRPSKKDIKAAIDKLKDQGAAGSPPRDSGPQPLAAKKSNKNRIRKQGV